MVDVPVCGEVLEWARTFRGLDEQTAADRLGISVDELAKYEQELKLPTLTMFERFAMAYQMPQSTLFRQNRPAEPKPPADYRTLDGQPPEHSFDFRVAVSNIRALQHGLFKVLADDDDASFPALPRMDRLRVDPWEGGIAERYRLGVSIEDQLSWTASEAFARWRAIVETTSVAVYLQKFDLSDCRGFSLSDDDQLPAIVINKSEENDRARIFTLIHEYAHILIREPGCSDQNNRNPVEAFCNRFAAGFLMPPEALRAVLKSWPNGPIEWPDETIKHCASRLKVSQRALALRLEEMGFAPAGFNRRFNWGGAPRPPRKSERGPHPVTVRLSELGGRISGAVVDAIDRGAIDAAAGAQTLGLGEEYLPRVREYVERRRALAGNN